MTDLVSLTIPDLTPIFPLIGQDHPPGGHEPTKPPTEPEPDKDDEQDEDEAEAGNS